MSLRASEALGVSFSEATGSVKQATRYYSIVREGRSCGYWTSLFP
jgi:hypothetical protein